VLKSLRVRPPSASQTLQSMQIPCFLSRSWQNTGAVAFVIKEWESSEIANVTEKDRGLFMLSLEEAKQNRFGILTRETALKSPYSAEERTGGVLSLYPPWPSILKNLLVSELAKRSDQGIRCPSSRENPRSECSFQSKYAGCILTGCC
jgi:hypothetical protein